MERIAGDRRGEESEREERRGEDEEEERRVIEERRGVGGGMGGEGGERSGEGRRGEERRGEAEERRGEERRGEEGSGRGGEGREGRSGEERRERRGEERRGEERMRGEERRGEESEKRREEKRREEKRREEKRREEKRREEKRREEKRREEKRLVLSFSLVSVHIPCSMRACGCWIFLAACFALPLFCLIPPALQPTLHEYMSMFAYAFPDLRLSSWILLYDIDARHDKVCFCLCPPFSFNFLGQFTMDRNQLLSDSREVSQILFFHCRDHKRNILQKEIPGGSL